MTIGSNGSRTVPSEARTSSGFGSAPPMRPFRAAGSRNRCRTVLVEPERDANGSNSSNRSRNGWAEDAPSISYTLFGEPLPMPRARIGRGRAYAPPLRIREAKERHREATELARPSGWDLEGSFALYVVCYRGTRRRCDGDNLQKLVADSLIGLAFADDSMVDVWHCEKRRDSLDPRTEVRVVRLTGEGPR